MALSIEAAVQQIRENPQPVVYIDTCVLLDLLRILPRDNLQTTWVSAAKECAQRTEQYRLHLVVMDIVRTEWDRNVSKVLEEGLDAIKRTNSLLTRAKSLAPLLNIELPSFQLPVSLMHALRQEGEDLLTVGITVKTDDARKLLAWDRASQARPPSSRGKPELNDCTIIEHYLAIAAQLADLNMPQIFVSSNTTDYGGGKAQLLPSLQAEFDAVALKWCSNLAWAVATIDAAH